MEMQIHRVAIIGAGTMGQGIGQELALAGYAVTLFRRSMALRQDAKERIKASLAEMVAWGLVTEDVVKPAMERIQIAESLEAAAARADLVIEAVFEDLQLKRQIFQNLDRVCPSRTILASTTSSLMPTQLASATQRPDRFLVLHFFYPPHLMPLVEIVPGELTSEGTLEMAVRLIKSLGKSPVVVQKEVPGFIANRLQTALRREALFLVDQGIATAQDVDIAVKESFGRRLAVAGPIEMAEVQDGWDVIGVIDQNILPHLDAAKEPSPIIFRKVAQGEVGPRTGKGFYEWTPESLEVWRKRLWTTLAGFMSGNH